MSHDRQPGDAARAPTSSNRSAGSQAPEEPQSPPAGPTTEGAVALAKALRPYLRKPDYFEYFDVWQRYGVHIMGVHFYSPVPDTRRLSPGLWRETSALVDIEMNDDIQLDFVRNVFPRFSEECRAIPIEPSESRFSLSNGAFSGTDALVLYCMLRHFKSERVVEVGSGQSSRLAAEAAIINGNTKLYCIEPYPNEQLKAGFPGLTELMEVPIQEVPVEFFEQLGEGDILFIDSTHVVKIGSDVNHLMFEVIPRVKPGVVIHFHDIFLPKEMPRNWVYANKLFWNEQYLLRAFLAFNSEFEVLFANSYMADNHLDEFKRAFPTSPWWGGGSFWLRRKVPAHAVFEPARQ